MNEWLLSLAYVAVIAYFGMGTVLIVKELLGLPSKSSPLRWSASDSESGSAGRKLSLARKLAEEGRSPQ